MARALRRGRARWCGWIVLLATVVLALSSGLSLSAEDEASRFAPSATMSAASGGTAAPNVLSRRATYVINGLAVGLLAGFFPISAVSFHRFRLPRKEEQYARVVRVLDLEKEPASLSMPALRSEFSGHDYGFPVVFATLIAGLGAFAVFFGNRFWDAADPSVPVFFRPLCTAELKDEACHAYGLSVIILAFLGGYIWSVQHILRRLVTVDLPPGSYFSVGLRLVFAPFLALVASFVVPRAAVWPVAFLIGFFPQEALVFLRNQFEIFKSSGGHEADPLPLDMVEGISFYHKIRLGEVGIDNAQNLACAGLAELVVRTPFRPRLLIDWITQARLCVAFRGKTARLRDAGVRTIGDLRNLGDKGHLDDIAKVSGVDERWLRAVYELARDDATIERLDEAGKRLGDA